MEQDYIAITGASSGIGAATAMQFAAEGYNLVMIAHDPKRLEAAASTIKNQYPTSKIVCRAVDLEDSEAVTRVYDSLADLHLIGWINDAGFGDYQLIADEDIQKVTRMIQLNVTALTLLSMRYVKDYQNVPGTQLINVSSAGGYLMVPTCVAYCATKYYVSAFTENLALELANAKAELKAKVFAPAATESNFGKVANGVSDYDYQTAFGDSYFTSEQSAEFLRQLFHDHDHFVGAIDRKRFEFVLSNNLFDYAGNSGRNQKLK